MKKLAIGSLIVSGAGRGSGCGGSNSPQTADVLAWPWYGCTCHSNISVSGDPLGG